MRLVIVSNRLPVTVNEHNGKLVFQESAGGLVSGINSYLESLKKSPEKKWDYLWIGWPGLAVEQGGKARGIFAKIRSILSFFVRKLKIGKKEDRLRSQILYQYKSYPVFLSKTDIDEFYYGFCNNTIWPLFLYFPVYATYDEGQWNHYKRVNTIFCDAVLKVIKPGDVVWIHDYQLMLLPKLLRERKPDLAIGFFLHIPFPAFEVFRLMPKVWRRELLQGVLGSDLIGFHTHEYTQYFLQCVLRILGFEHSLGEMIAGGRRIKADTFPMGIDFDKFHDAVSSDRVESEKQKLRVIFKDNRVIFSVDRLDYTKGILNSLKGYARFLESNPVWHNRVVFVLVVIPSRTGVERYQQIKKEIDELVGNINGRFGNMSWMPLVYQYRAIYFEYLVALYSISDVALITPLRDGMNLVAKEYIASRLGEDGVLILSEMAGASKELGEAIIINPNDIAEISGSLLQALEMPKDEMRRRNEAMQKRLQRCNVIKWADEFLGSLVSIKEEQGKLCSRLLSRSSKTALFEAYGKANDRLLLLDYDGTLVPFKDYPQEAVPPAHLMKILQDLSSNTKNDMVIISGRDKRTLRDWFSTFPLGLAAEYGAWIKEREEDWKMLKSLTNNWKPHLYPILELYVDRLPGSFIEEKEYALVWHYRKADPEMASLRQKELVEELLQLTAGIDVQVVRGSKVVEIRSAGINKGNAALHWISKRAYDFILAVGDDWTDEEMFTVLPEGSFSFRVGITPSHARFSVQDHTEVQSLLAELARCEDRA